MLKDVLGSLEDWYLVGKIHYFLRQYHSTISIFVQHGLIEKSPLARYLAAKCAVRMTTKDSLKLICQIYYH